MAFAGSWDPCSGNISGLGASRTTGCHRDAVVYSPKLDQDAVAFLVEEDCCGLPRALRPLQLLFTATLQHSCNTSFWHHPAHSIRCFFISLPLFMSSSSDS